MDKEYIDRASAIKMIEEDLPEVVYYRKEDAIECLECLPSADVVEVVRCKDCKHNVSGVCRHDFALNFMRDNDFCSYGERREE